jgi:hypothetical protein
MSDRFLLREDVWDEEVVREVTADLRAVSL